MKAVRSQGVSKDTEAYNLCGCWKQFRLLLRVSIELASQTETSAGNEGPEAYTVLQENRTHDHYKLDTKEHLECEKNTILIFNIVVLLNFFFFFHTFLSISWAFTFIPDTWLVSIQLKVAWEFIRIILNSHNHFGWFDLFWYNVSLSKKVVCPSICSDLLHIFWCSSLIFLVNFIF